MALAESEPLPAGQGDYLLEDHVRVFYSVPENISEQTPVWFIIHGMNRNADEYRDNWIKLGKKHAAIILAPEFTKKAFPNFHTGGAFDRLGQPLPRQATQFHLIERIFDDVVQRCQLKAEKYCLFGHSAGGQFVHRMVLFYQPSRVQLAVAANAGWYTMPVLDVAYPYGLGQTPLTKKDLRASLAAPLCVLLGDQDIDPEHRNLNRSPQANEQGPHRFARGQLFFQLGEQASKRLKSPFGWKQQIVPGVAHSNGRMAPAAAELMSQASRGDTQPDS